jgi:hypothetical protein
MAKTASAGRTHAVKPAVDRVPSSSAAADASGQREDAAGPQQHQRQRGPFPPWFPGEGPEPHRGQALHDAYHDGRGGESRAQLEALHRALVGLHAVSCRQVAHALVKLRQAVNGVRRKAVADEFAPFRLDPHQTHFSVRDAPVRRLLLRAGARYGVCRRQFDADQDLQQVEGGFHRLQETGFRSRKFDGERLEPALGACTHQLHVSGGVGRYRRARFAEKRVQGRARRGDVRRTQRVAVHLFGVRRRRDGRGYPCRQDHRADHSAYPTVIPCKGTVLPSVFPAMTRLLFRKDCGNVSLATACRGRVRSSESSMPAFCLRRDRCLFFDVGLDRAWPKCGPSRRNEALIKKLR